MRRYYKTVVFLSGKGGAGKTTVAISFATLLSALGKTVLLIDFDLATSGASFFFKPKFETNDLGIWECLKPALDGGAQGQVQFGMPALVRIDQRFLFIPSRTRLNAKGSDYYSTIFSLQMLRDNLLKDTILNRSLPPDVEYVLIDCQAGYSITSAAASELAELGIVVSETDAIASEAAQNVVSQLGDNVPRDLRFLWNKLEVRDIETYRATRDFALTIARLPPLPFDFEVRRAFGSRRVPVDLGKPSSSLFALFDVVRAALPELDSEMEVYREKHIAGLFERYTAEFKETLAKRDSLLGQLAAVKDADVQFSQKLFRLMMVVAGLLTAIIGNYLAGSISGFESARLWPNWLSVVGGTIAVTGSLYYVSFLWNRRLEARQNSAIERQRIQLQLEVNARDVENYRSLVVAKSGEYLIDRETAEKLSAQTILPKPFKA